MGRPQDIPTIGARGAIQVRYKLGLADEAPVCVYELADSLGVNVRFKGGHSFGGMYDNQSKTILVPAWRPPGRQAFTCAHELGHWYFGHGTRLDALESDGRLENQCSPEEWLANAFAAHLLMPLRAVRDAFRRRGWEPAGSKPAQVYTVACQLNEHALALDPESQSLQEEIDLLREDLAHLLAQEHDLLHIIKPNLLALYQQKLGPWELRCLQAQVTAARARRKLEMARAALNRGQRPDWGEIEGQLELEFLTWQQRLREAAQRVEAAGQRLKNLLPPAEDRELKKLYYTLVKALHPDATPDLDEGQRRLWQRVQDAYACADLDELRALALLAGRKGDPATANSGGIEALRRQRDILGKHVVELERRIDAREAQPPFPLRELLADVNDGEARQTTDLE